MKIITDAQLTNALAINDNLEVQKVSDYIVVIDNFFKNFDLLTDITEQIVFTDFNSSFFCSDHYKKRSFQDLRGILHIKTQYLFNFRIQRLLYQMFGFKSICDHNMYWTATKWKSKINQKVFGECPHLDPGVFVGVTYFTEDGGTNIYFDKRGFLCDETKSLNTDDYLTEHHMENYYELAHHIEAKLNRMVIFSGDLIHGASISENENVDDYRKIAIWFFEEYR